MYWMKLGMVLVAAAGLAACETQSAGGKNFGANLSGAANPAAKGNADVSYDPASKTAKWNVAYSGLSGPATMAHFHGPAAAGANAPPVVWLSPQGQPVPNPIVGQAQLTDEQAQQLMNGMWYVNVHTEANK